MLCPICATELTSEPRDSTLDCAACRHKVPREWVEAEQRLRTTYVTAVYNMLTALKRIAALNNTGGVLNPSMTMLASERVANEAIARWRP